LRKHPENGRTMLTTKVVLRGGRPGRSKVVEHEEVKWASNQTVSFAVPLKEVSIHVACQKFHEIYYFVSTFL